MVEDGLWPGGLELAFGFLCVLYHCREALQDACIPTRYTCVQ